VYFICLSGLVSLSALFDLVGISLLAPIIINVTDIGMSIDNEFRSGVLSWLIMFFDEFDLFNLLSIFVGVFIAKAIYNTVVYYLQSWCCFNLQANISEKLVSKYLSLSPDKFYRNDTNDYIRNCIQETDQFNFSVLMSILSLTSEVVVCLCLLSLMFFIDPTVAGVVALLAMALAFIFIWGLKPYLVRLGEARQLNFGKRLKVLRQSLDGFKEIKISQRADMFLKEYTKYNRLGNHSNYTAHWLSQLPRFWMELSAAMIIFATMYIFSTRGIFGSELIAILGIYVASAVRIMPSVSRITSSVNYLAYSDPVIDLLMREIETQVSKTQIIDKYVAKADSSCFLGIIDGKYRHDDSKDWQLEIDLLEIRRGEKVFVYGPSGGGKTTLIDLLIGFKRLDSGYLLSSNQVYGNYDTVSWENFSYCSQFPYIFDKSIDFNITIEEDDVDYFKLQKVKEIAHIDDLHEGLSRGVDDTVGEVEYRLSGGQKQRIGIARALYKNNVEIYVFDEITSNLDESLSNNLVIKVLESLKDKTVIFVSHDLSLASNFDTVYEVKNGTIHPK